MGGVADAFRLAQAAGVSPVFQYLPKRVFTHTSLAVEVADVGFVSRTIGVGGPLAMYFS